MHANAVPESDERQALGCGDLLSFHAGNRMRRWRPASADEPCVRGDAGRGRRGASRCLHGHVQRRRVAVLSLLLRRFQRPSALPDQDAVLQSGRQRLAAMRSAADRDGVRLAAPRDRAHRFPVTFSIKSLNEYSLDFRARISRTRSSRCASRCFGSRCTARAKSFIAFGSLPSRFATIPR